MRGKKLYTYYVQVWLMFEPEPMTDKIVSSYAMNEREIDRHLYFEYNEAVRTWKHISEEEALREDYSINLINAY
jgi:hypothetical protein